MATNLKNTVYERNFNHANDFIHKPSKYTIFFVQQQILHLKHKGTIDFAIVLYAKKNKKIWKIRVLQIWVLQIRFAKPRKKSSKTEG